MAEAEALRAPDLRRGFFRRPDVYITFPAGGGWRSIPAGTVVIDLLTGEVLLPDGTTDGASTSLREHGFTHARSSLVEADRSVEVYYDTGGKYTIGANEVIPVTHQYIRKIFVEASETTDIRVWASTNPENIPRKFVGITSLAPIVYGTPVAEYGRYSGSDATYQTLASWTVSTGREGELGEVAMACANTTSYTNARFRLTIAGEVQFTEARLDLPLNLPFPRNKLDAGDQVLLEVRSVSGTVTAAGSITGKEM